MDNKFKPNVSKLRKDRDEIEMQTKRNHYDQFSSYRKNNKPWPQSVDGEVSYFSDEANHDHLSFEQLEGWVHLRKRLDGMRTEPDIKITGIDIMGQGSPCTDVGCDNAIALTLPTAGFEEAESKDANERALYGIDTIWGNVFEPEQAKQLLNDLKVKLQDANNKLGVVFFRPWGGMNQYDENEYAWRYLLQHVFTPLYEKLEDNGVMLFELHSLSDELFETILAYLEQSDIKHKYLQEPDRYGKGSGTRLLKVEK